MNFKEENMKYLNIYNEVLEEFMNKAAELKNDERTMENEWMIIAEALKNPEKNPKFFCTQLHEKYNVELSEQDIKKQLRDINLNSVIKRQEMIKHVVKAADDVKRTLDGDKDSINNLEAFLEKVIERTDDGRIKFKNKCLLTYLFNLDDELKNHKFNIMLVKFREVYCGKVLKKLISSVCKKEGINKRKDTLKVIEKTQETIKSASYTTNLTGDKDKQIENLLFEIGNYQNTIEVLQSMLDDLKESIDDVSKEAEKSAVSDFFIKLNSAQYGTILDSFVVVENKLSEIKKLNIKLPNQLVVLPIIFKQLLKFTKDIGITPIDTIGRTFEANYRDIALMNYNGEPFIDDDEVKSMEIEKCGWKFEDIVISAPTVKEKLDA